MSLWTEKYKPKTGKDIIGQEDAVNAVKRFLANFRTGKKAAILVGPTGVGKTCIPYAIASDMQWEILEANASDFRGKEEVNSTIGSALFQRSLFSSGKIILVDEIDALSSKDRGGLQALQKLIETAPYPIVLTASDLSDFKFNSLKRISEVIELGKIPTEKIAEHLMAICSEEGINSSLEVMKSIARRSGNDIRGAINDVQSLAGNREVTREDVDLLSERERTETLVNALTRIFKTTDVHIAMASLDYVSEDVNEYFLWIDENLPKEYERPEDISNAYSCISKADVFNRRIISRQYFRFLVYINALLSGGVALSKGSKYKGVAKFSPPGRLLKVYWAKQKSAKKKSIAGKIPIPTSVRSFIKEEFPFISHIFRHNKGMAAAMASEFRLEEEDILFLKRDH
ncbi:replication factor C large subunit [Candidatus Woesearchaeota archaeon]|nr:replication factor C large subunit [Candidatus Woesearchaeota archaeon]